MTSAPLNLAYLQKTTSTVKVITENKQTFRLIHAFSFYLNQNWNVRVDTVNTLQKQFAQALEMTWKSKTAGW